MFDKVLKKFFLNNTFVIQNPMEHTHQLNFNLNVKVRINEIQETISTSSNNDNLSLKMNIDIIVLPSGEMANKVFNVFWNFQNFEKEVTHVKDIEYLRWFFHPLTNLVENVLKYFSIDLTVINVDRIINETESETLTEGFIMESRYDGVVRQLVSDIISIYKENKEGDFTLPEDLSTNRKPNKDDDSVTYKFKGIENEFTVELKLFNDDSIESFDLDANYYPDDDVIEVIIISNSDAENEHMQELIGDLNETIRHELEHIYQHQKSYPFPKKEPKKPFKYYTQQHELEAQHAGFNRRARKEKRPIEDIIRSWFKKNQSKHKLTQTEIDKVISKILNR